MSDACEFCTFHTEFMHFPPLSFSFTSPRAHAPSWRQAYVPVTPRRVGNGFAQQALAAEATYSNRVTEREHAAATLNLCTVSASAQARVTTRLQDDSEG